MGEISSLIEKMNNGQNPVFKDLYGVDPNILCLESKRYEELMLSFKKEFGKSEVTLFSSPGRTEIGGNHTDHQHGRVLAGAVNLDNIAVVSKNETNIVRIKSEGYPQFQVDLEDLSVNKDQFYTSQSLVRGIAARLRDLNFKIGGFDACIDGRVPKGSGLSSSASFEVLIGAIFSHLFNDGKLDAVNNAIIGQWSENNYFGKPCGLMDQTACSVGGFITIDFKDPSKPIVKALDFDFQKTDYVLIITDTGGSHADLNDEYASLPAEMKSVAKSLGQEVLRETSIDDILKKIPEIRDKVGDRALLRAIHFQGDNSRVEKQVYALENNDFESFLDMVIDSGASSYMYNQNIFAVNSVHEQGVSLGLALSEMVLKGKGAWRVHGGGFAGTIQAFVPKAMVNEYVSTLEHVFGEGKCHKLFIRSKGAVMLSL